MRRNKNIVLEKILVEDYAAEGKSLTRQDGKVIFIENVVPGDVVDVRLTKNKKDWAEGYPLKFESYSQERTQPFCQHFGVCGGCQWQMLPYEKQLQYKQKQVHDNLKRIGKVQMPEMLPIVGATKDKFYRNKLEYTFSTKEYLPAGSFDRDDKERGFHNVVGFHAKGFFDKVVDIQKCWLQDDLTNQIRNSIRSYAKLHGLSFYDIREHRGFLRTMQLRICTTGEVMVNIVLGEEQEKKRTALLRFVLQTFPSITTLLYTINLKRNDSMHDLEPQVYHGKGYVVEQLEEFKFKIGPKSFFQTNTAQGERLYQITRNFAELDGNQVVYDLYCGTGSIGIFCSKDAKKIIGVEMIEAAIADAKENAALNNIEHAHFFAGDVIDVCNDDFFAAHGKADVIITDPPRAGMHEKLVKKILEMDAPIVVYVSCNPATQARDLALLDEKYTVTEIQPVDMFPHTHHIENVVQLKLK
ncbi:MAG: 23S rRNA (uracil(1939)-C(5))-methyltransferase RlmD [Chitinophagaceae bacterium]